MSVLVSIAACPSACQSFFPSEILFAMSPTSVLGMIQIYADYLIVTIFLVYINVAM